MNKRILVVGTREFFAGYRIDRALVRASKGHEPRNMTLVTIGLRSGGCRRGADAIARQMADDFGWRVETAANVSDARPDVCLAFLHNEDDPMDRARVAAMKAEKHGTPTWRYYE